MLAAIYDFMPLADNSFVLKRGAASILPKAFVSDNQARFKENGAALKTSVRATFSGMLINGRVYPGVRVEDSAKTWTADYNKPVLTHHASGMGGIFGPPPVDPIGRVLNQTYSRTVSDSAWEKDWKRPLRKGSGHIDLGLSITDADAIGKVLDGRFKSVSIGGIPSNLWCSICAQDWLVDGRCEHEPGKVVERGGEDSEKKVRRSLAYLITGNLAYKEISFVNVPAAPGAQVIGIDGVEDSQYSWDQVPDPVMMVMDSLELGSDRYQIQMIGEQSAIEVAMDAENDAVVAESVLDSLPEPTEPTPPFSDEEFALLNVADHMLRAGVADPAELADELDIDLEEFLDQLEDLSQDARLTTKQRKGLKGSTFCGPNRSFPVPDCAHYTAALRLLGRYKGPGDKGRIRSCIQGKGRSMGCSGFKSKDSMQPKPHHDSLESLRQGKSGTVTDTDKVPNMSTQTGSDTDDKERAMSDATAIPEGSPSKDKSTEDSTVTRVLTEKVESQAKQIENLQKALDDKAEEAKTLLDTNERLHQELHDGLATRLLELRLATKHPDVADVKDQEGRDRILEDLKSRTIESLRDSVQDEQKRLYVAETVEEKPADIEPGSVTQEDAEVLSRPVEETPKAKNKDLERKFEPQDYQENFRRKMSQL